VFSCPSYKKKSSPGQDVILLNTLWLFLQFLFTEIQAKHTLDSEIFSLHSSPAIAQLIQVDFTFSCARLCLPKGRCSPRQNTNLPH